MRIVDVCAFYSPHGGGVKTYIRQKMESGPRLGHEIIVLAPGPRDEIVERRRGATLATIAAPMLPLDRRYRYFDDEARLQEVLDRWAPDVVEASSPWGSAAMVGRWQGRALRSLIMHADPLATYAYRWFGGIMPRETIDWGFAPFWEHLRRLDQSFDMIVTAGAGLRHRLTAGGLNKVVTVPMGVEPRIFSPALRDEQLRAELLARCQLPPEATLLICVGRMAAEKRLPMVIEAVAAAAGNVPIGLVLFGAGKLRGKVLRAIGDNPHIHLFEPISDRGQFARLLASADALVHGCEAETFCMAAAEARASGLPLIVPDEGGAADQFVEGRGKRYRSADGADLRDKLIEFVGDHPHLHRAQARLDASRVRTTDAHFADLLSIYQARALRRAA
jgi:alpha-1,6-mannosyltransferase